MSLERAIARAVMLVIREELGKLHGKKDNGNGWVFCNWCTDYSGDLMEWPCPTMKIVEGE